MGLLGPLVGFLRVPEAYEAAIESVLGERLQYLVAESDNATQTAIAKLRDAGNGSLWFCVSRERKSN